MAETTPECVDPSDLFVSPDGDDAWSGERADPAPDGTDGPFATLDRARRAVRERKRAGAVLPSTVWLRGGRYPVEEPVTFEPADSAPVTYAAYPGEDPVVTGGRRIDGWTETTVNGVEAWVADVPGVAAGDWYFRQLFVDGERRPRPRLPADGFYEVADVPYDGEGIWNAEGGVSYAFDAAPGDVEEWSNLADVDVCIPHRWVVERSPVASVDGSRVRMAFYAKMWLDGGERYWVENVFEALSDPGEWYLDRGEGRLYYVPKPGEDPADVEVVAPVPLQVLRVAGDPDAGDFVDFLTFEGLTFAHAAWEYPARIDAGRRQTPDHPLHDSDGAATSVQAQYLVPGAVSLTGARNCTLRDCTVEHVGLYGLQLGTGCTANRVVRSTVRDTGAGAVKVEGGCVEDPRAGRTGRNRVADNHLVGGGRVFPAGVGVLARHTFDNDVSHNYVHDFYYSGISCGWTWGYGACVDRDNRIAYNHVHDVGQGLLSDLAGVYTLGVQPGTEVRGNHVHDVAAHDYGGWGIYPDEGSSHLVIADNLVHDTTSQAFHQHYGRENVVRNNVFALGEEGQVTLSRTGDGVSFTFQRNVVVTDGEPVFLGGYDCDLSSPADLDSDLNLVWDVEGRPLTVAPDRNGDDALAFDAWRDRGFDRHSEVADPGFADIDARDFALDEESPAREVGFEPLDTSSVGPRDAG